MNATLAPEWISHLAGWAADASLSVMLPALLVLGLSRLRLIPARWCALLAALLLVRLLLPAVVPVSWRGVSHVTSAAELTPPPKVVQSLRDWSQPEAMLRLRQADDTSHGVTGLLLATSTAAPGAASLLVAALPWVWATGAAAVIGWLAFSLFQVRRLVSAARPAGAHLKTLLCDCARAEGLSKTPGIFVIRGLPSVAIYGWLRPRLLVPEGIEQTHTEGELRGIFLHELQHVRRADGLWTLLGVLACAMHWFNPLAWLLFRRFCADRELACDEAALARLHHDARRSYGEALIKTAELSLTPSLALLPSFSSTPTELKHRMKLIMKPASRSLLVQLVSVGIAFGTATFAFTTAQADGEKKKPAAEGDAKEELRKADGEGDGVRKTAREGDDNKKATRDGDGAKKEGARDGDGERKGPRDGEMKKSGARDGEGEAARKGARDGEGEGRKSAEREGGGKMREGGSAEKPATKAAATGSQELVIQVNAEGNVVNSKGEVIDIKMVRGRMKQIADENPDQSVTLRADADTAYAKVLNVLDALKDAGLKDVKLESGKK